MQFLYQTVRDILDSGRIGVPVFARCAVQIESDGECLKNVFARILTMTCSWMKAAPFRIYAQSGKSQQFTVTAHYAGGQTAIVSANAAPGVRASVDLMLLGNRGALYHDADSLQPGFDVTAEPLPAPEWLAEAVERSLRTGRPASIEEVTDFE